MMLAQKLYEGVDVSGELKGLITYMRTDSTRLSNSFVSSSLELIESSWSMSFILKIFGMVDDPVW